MLSNAVWSVAVDGLSLLVLSTGSGRGELTIGPSLDWSGDREARGSAR